VDSRAGLDAVEKRKMIPSQESNPGHPAHTPSLYQLGIQTPPALQAILKQLNELYNRFLMIIFTAAASNGPTLVTKCFSNSTY
jgi:hypothetical protein